MINYISKNFMYEFVWYIFILIFIQIHLILIFIIYLVKYANKFDRSGTIIIKKWNDNKSIKNRNSRSMSRFWEHLFDFSIEEKLRFQLS